MLLVEGVLTRTVTDTAAILDVIAGYEPGDASWAPPPAHTFAHAAAIGRTPGRLRIAATVSSPLPGARVDPQAADAVREASALLDALGHHVEEVEPPWRAEGLDVLFGVVFCAEVALSIASSGVIAGREPEEADLEPMSWAIFQMIREMGALEARGAVVRLQAFTRQLIAFLEGWDALLTPALAERPLALGTLDPAAPEPLSTFSRSGLFTPFTPVFNATGQPAISLPLFEGRDGLPLAVQLVGRPAREDVLLALARELEETTPWAARRPRLALDGDHSR